MSTTTLPETDWESVYQISLGALNNIEWLAQTGLPKNIWFRDCRTIHMGAGRQSGVSKWSKQLMLRDDTTLLLEPNPDLRDMATEDLVRLGIANARERVFTSRDLLAIANTAPTRFETMISACKMLILDDAQFIPSMTFSDRPQLSLRMRDLLPLDTVILRLK